MMSHPSITDSNYYQYSGTQQDYLNSQYQAQESWRLAEESRRRDEERWRDEQAKRAEEERRNRCLEEQSNSFRNRYTFTDFSSSSSNNENNDSGNSIFYWGLTNQFDLTYPTLTDPILNTFESDNNFQNNLFNFDIKPNPQESCGDKIKKIFNDFINSNALQALPCNQCTIM